MPSPPPAYSPPPDSFFQNQNSGIASSIVTATTHSSSSAAMSPQSSFVSPTNPAVATSGPSTTVPPQYNQHRSGTGYQASPVSPNVTPTVSFAPPPPSAGQRDKSAGRSSRFAFSALTSRNRPSDNRLSLAMDHEPPDRTAGEARVSASLSVRNPSIEFSSQDMQRASTLLSQPPSARRAVSAGAIGASGTFAALSAGVESTAGTTAWYTSNNLPPPPPGPPPNSRSQSSSRAADYRPAAPPTRRPHVSGSALDTIPSTPANWNGEQLTSSPIDFAQLAECSSPPLVESQRRESFHELSQGGPSARGIRERRIESRALRHKVQEGFSSFKGSDAAEAEAVAPAESAKLVLNQRSTSQLTRRPAVMKPSPRSAKSISSPGSNLANREIKDGPSVETVSRVWPARPSVTTHFAPQQSVPTPPFSPEEIQKHLQQKISPSTYGSKTLPTPPLQTSKADPFPLTGKPRNARPVSHLLHTPNEEDILPAPLTPSRSPPTVLASPVTQSADGDAFAKDCRHRHRMFIELELSAGSDEERLELFARFILQEAEIRRERYSSAFENVAERVSNLTRDLWLSAQSGRQSSTPKASEPGARELPTKPQSAALQRDTRMANEGKPTADSSASSSAAWTPTTEPDSPVAASGSVRSRPDAHWTDGFAPVLSPILSMAVSTVLEEDGSRGRSASRWWDASANGSVGGSGRIQRSKRESKYMGLPKEDRQNLQWDGANTSSAAGEGISKRNQYALNYGPDEYPPEKLGWYEPDSPEFRPRTSPEHDSYPNGDSTTSVRSTTCQSNTYYVSSPKPLGSSKLDVSRLITLPPPYPRHHPAINNSHPDLQTIRNDLRMLSDLTDAEELQARFASSQTRVESLESVNQRKRKFLMDLQVRTSSGSISFSEAAKLEVEFIARETNLSKYRAQKDFDAFQKAVMTPLHALFSERITRASACIEHLRSGLFKDAQYQNPNQTQEEGDEQPELLEKLTLVKWLFEAREQLHRERFQLEDLHSNRYKDVILVPYQVSANEEKIREAEAFFDKDRRDRRLAFEEATVNRAEGFLSVIEENVMRGVEMQLSAFWDIAPGLLAVVQQVPEDLERFEILIPPQEYQESPAYHDHPLQYLFTLLDHSSKSAYQFIESQINLLCLLHEVKTGAVVARCRLMERKRRPGGAKKDANKSDVAEGREMEEAVLTADLKDKVDMVEEQWREALGAGLEACRGRVKAFLHETGGWDDGLVE